MTKTYTLRDGSTFTVTAKNKRKSKHWGQEHFAYTIVIERDGLTYKTTYHDSAMNFYHNQGATEQMINSALNCVVMDYYAYDSNRDFNDFIDEYGYDYEDENGVKAYNGCFEAYTYLKRLFSIEEIDEIAEMTD